MLSSIIIMGKHSSHQNKIVYKKIMKNISSLIDSFCVRTFSEYFSIFLLRTVEADTQLPVKLYGIRLYLKNCIGQYDII